MGASVREHERKISRNELINAKSAPSREIVQAVSFRGGQAAVAGLRALHDDRSITGGVRCKSQRTSAH